MTSRRYTRIDILVHMYMCSQPLAVNVKGINWGKILKK